MPQPRRCSHASMGPTCLVCVVHKPTEPFVSCIKCKDQFHESCVKESLAYWRSHNRRKSTWQCVNCCPLPDPTAPPKCKCECNIRDKLTTELNSAKHTIQQLQQKIADLTAALEIAHGKHQRQPLPPAPVDQEDRSWALVTKKGRRSAAKPRNKTPTHVHMKNSFSPLQSQVLEDEAPPAARANEKVTPIDRKTPRRQNQKKKKNVLMVTDSHGRDCGLLMQRELGEDINCLVVAKPGAPFNVVVRSALDVARTFKPDHVIVLAGTNDVCSPRHVPHLNIAPLMDLPVSTSVSISHVPFRYDNTRLNRVIENVNRNLDTKVQELDIENINTVDISSLTYRDHTRHGLHLSKFGKQKLCKILCKALTKHPKHLLHSTSSEHLQVLTSTPTAPLPCKAQPHANYVPSNSILPPPSPTIGQSPIATQIVSPTTKRSSFLA